jgi:hypothetical protein
MKKKCMNKQFLRDDFSALLKNESTRRACPDRLLRAHEQRNSNIRAKLGQGATKTTKHKNTMA